MAVAFSIVRRYTDPGRSEYKEGHRPPDETYESVFARIAPSEVIALRSVPMGWKSIETKQ